MKTSHFKDLIIHKKPESIDDSSFFTFIGLRVDKTFIDKMRHENQYFNTKFQMFEQQIIDKEVFLKSFTNESSNLPSLKNINLLPNLSSTIYTNSIEVKNEELERELIFENIKLTLNKNPKSRRMFVRLANYFGEYLESENHNNVDISCLTGIHYLQNSVTLFSRALSFYEEFYVDIILIYWFLLAPVYGKNPVTINWMVSTSQFSHIKQLNNFKNRLAKLFTQ